MSGNGNLENIETKSMNLYDIYCDGDKVDVQLKAHHPKHHGSLTQLCIVLISGLIFDNNLMQNLNDILVLAHVFQILYFESNVLQ